MKHGIRIAGDGATGIAASMVAGIVYGIIASAPLLFVLPARAHHSFAMFDFEKTAQIEGVVKELRFTSPHIWLYVNVTDAKNGRVVEYGIEGTAPNTLLRAGWRSDSLKPGDKVKVSIHPLRSGEPGGSMVAVEVNGRAIGNAP